MVSQKVFTDQVGSLQKLLDERSDQLERSLAVEVYRTAQYYRKLEESLDKRFDEVTEEIAARRERGQEPTYTQILRLEKTAKLIEQTRARADLYAESVGQVMDKARLKGVNAGIVDGVDLTTFQVRHPRTGELIVNVARLGEREIEAAKTLLDDSNPFINTLATFSNRAETAVKDAINTGMALGEHPDDIKRRLKKTLGAAMTAPAQTMVRTEMYRAYREGNRQVFEENEDLLDGWTWRSLLSNTTCAACWAMHGTVFPAKTPMGTHPNCRCIMVPKTKSWEELGFPGIDDLPLQPSGPELFERLPATDKKRILGPTAYSAFQNNRLRLRDMVATTHHQIFGTIRSKASLLAAYRNFRNSQHEESRWGMGDLEIDDKQANDFLNDATPHDLSDNELFTAPKYLVPSNEQPGGWDFTPERKALHDQIIRHFMEGVPETTNPTIWMLGGGPGAGKSTLVNSGLTPIPKNEERKTALVNADDIRAMLPEYQQYVAEGRIDAAGLVHEEASYITKRALRAGIQRGLDVTFDGVGNKFGRVLQEAKPFGYKVRGVYAFIPDPEVAVVRAEERGKKTGRYVDPTLIREGHLNVSRIFNDAAKALDTMELYDTSGRPSGTDPARLVGYKTQGKPFRITDVRRFNEFRAVSGLPPVQNNRRRNDAKPPPRMDVRNIDPDPLSKLQIVTDKIRDDITADERNAIARYVESGFELGNVLLRDDDPENRTKFGNTWDMVGRIDSIMDRSTVPVPLRAYRGMNFTVRGADGWDAWLNSKPGDVIRDKGFVSTSLSESEALKFAAWSGDQKTLQDASVLVEVLVPSGTPGLFLDDDLSHRGAEQELLIDRGQQFLIRSNEPLEGGVGRRIVVELMPTPKPSTRNAAAPPRTIDIEALRKKFSTEAELQRVDALLSQEAQRLGAIYPQPPFSIEAVREAGRLRDELGDEYVAKYTHQESMQAYKGFTYKDINSLLRTGELHPETMRMHEQPFSGEPSSPVLIESRRKEIRQIVSNMDDFFKETETPEDLITYRGIDFKDQPVPAMFADAKPGDILQDPGFVSTSLSEGLARAYYAESGEFVNNQQQAVPGSVKLEFVIPAGTKAVYMDPAIKDGGSNGEVELLLNRNTRTLVREVKPIENGVGKHITLEVLPETVRRNKAAPPPRIDVDALRASNNMEGNAAALGDVSRGLQNVLTEEQKHVAGEYATVLSAEVNPALREGDNETYEEEVGLLTAAITEATIPNDMMLFRGAGFFDDNHPFTDLTPGAVLQDDAFVSTTIDSFQAEQFAIGTTPDKAFLFEIAAPKGAKGLYISNDVITDDQSLFEHEREVLLPPGTRFVVQEVIPEDNLTRVIVQLLRDGEKPPPGVKEKKPKKEKPKKPKEPSVDDLLTAILSKPAAPTGGTESVFALVDPSTAKDAEITIPQNDVFGSDRKQADTMAMIFGKKVIELTGPGGSFANRSLGGSYRVSMTGDEAGSIVLAARNEAAPPRSNDPLSEDRIAVLEKEYKTQFAGETNIEERARSEAIQREIGRIRRNFDEHYNDITQDGTIDGEMVAALQDYTHNGFAMVNEALRGNQPMTTSALGVMKHVARAMGVSRTPEDAVVWRGIQNIPEDSDLWKVKPGDVMKDPAFVSSSFRQFVAQGFAGTGQMDDQIMFRIVVPGGTPAVYITDDLQGMALMEEELLLDRNTRFLVRDVKPYENTVGQTFKGTQIDLEVLPPGRNEVAAPPVNPRQEIARNVTVPDNFETVDDAVATFEELGVTVEIESLANDVGPMIAREAERIREMVERGLTPPAKIRYEHHGSDDSFGYGEYYDNSITINLAHMNPERDMRVRGAQEINWWVNAGPEHTIIHESMHMEHYRALGIAGLNTGEGHEIFEEVRTALSVLDWSDLPEDPHSILRKQVSQYAATDGFEAVAEIATGHYAGIRYSDEVYAIYDRLGGPRLEGRAPAPPLQRRVLDPAVRAALGMNPAWTPKFRTPEEIATMVRKWKAPVRVEGKRKPLWSAYEDTLKARKRDDLVEAEKLVVTGYTYKGDEVMNGALRSGGITASTQELIDTMDQVLRKTPLEQDTVLYRGLAFADDYGVPQEVPEEWANLQPGDVLQDPAYLSTSLYDLGAKRFSGNGKVPNGFDMVIIAPKGTPSVYVSPELRSENVQHEHEVVIPRNSRLLVRGITELPAGEAGRDYPVKRVVAELIPEPPANRAAPPRTGADWDFLDEVWTEARGESFWRTTESTQEFVAKTMPIDERDAVNDYVQSGYEDINFALVEVGSHPQADLINSAIDRTPLTQQIKVYRGMSFTIGTDDDGNEGIFGPDGNLSETFMGLWQGGIGEGAIFESAGFTSTSTKRSVAEDFSAGFTTDNEGAEVEFMFDIALPAGTPALAINDKLGLDKAKTQEREMLLKSGQRFLINRVERLPNNVVNVRMELLPERRNESRPPPPVSPEPEPDLPEPEFKAPEDARRWFDRAGIDTLVSMRDHYTEDEQAQILEEIETDARTWMEYQRRGGGRGPLTLEYRERMPRGAWGRAHAAGMAMELAMGPLSRDRAAEMKAAYESGHWSSPSVGHGFVHEMSHIEHYRVLGIDHLRWPYDPKNPDWQRWDALQSRDTLTESEKLLLRLNVSNYAATNMMEAVAEIRAGHFAGKRYNEDVMALYEKLSGPPLLSED